MCKCTPEIRTPFCGKPGCEWPTQKTAAARYRKKPVEVLAMCFSTNSESDDACMNAIVIWINQGKSPNDGHAWHNGTNIFIVTLEGLMSAECGDYIIKGVQGEFYPCKPSIFAATYEKV